MKLENSLVSTVLLAMVFGVILFNAFLQLQLNSQITGMQGLVLAGENAGAATSTSTQSQQSSPQAQQSQPAVDPAKFQEAVARIMPKGMPPVYGGEMQISFDRPEEAIVALSKYDGGWATGANAIKFADLGEEEKQRYLKIGTSIACEFCCGAKTMVAKDGEAACGCAHSAAMRGLAKYLLKNHAAEFSDEQILEEVVKVKTLSFPKQMVERALSLEAKGQSINSVTQSLPSQVGGC